MKELKKENIVTGSELEILIGEALGEIKALIDTNKYQVKNEQVLDELWKKDYKITLKNSSYKTIKKLNKQLRWWSIKPDRQSANRLIHFLRTRVLGKLQTKYYISSYKTEIPSIKIEASLKEQTIQKKRKEWLKLRDEADKALAAYKTEKGDFYKNQTPIKKEERELELA